MAGTPIYLLRIRPLPFHFLAAAARFHSHTFLRALDYYPRQKALAGVGVRGPNCTVNSSERSQCCNEPLVAALISSCRSPLRDESGVVVSIAPRLRLLSRQNRGVWVQRRLVVRAVERGCGVCGA